MTRWFYYDKNGKQGPFSDEDMKLLISADEINVGTIVEMETGRQSLARDIPGWFQEPPTQKFTPPPVLPPQPAFIGISEKKVTPPPVLSLPSSSEEERWEPTRTLKTNEDESEKMIWYTRNRRYNVCYQISETKFRNLIRRGVIDENAFFSRKDPGNFFYIRERVETYPDFWDLCPPKTRLHKDDMTQLAWMMAWRIFAILLLAELILQFCRIFLGRIFWFV